MNSVKVSVSLYSYGWDIKNRKMSVKDCIEHAASLGVDGIELVDKQHIPKYPYPSLYDLEELRDCIKSFGLNVSCYSTYVDDLLRTAQRAMWEEQAKMVLDDIAETRLLGAKVVRPAMAITSTEYFPATKKVMEYVSPTLKKYGVRWAF